MKYIVVIPARYKSSRLQGKALIKLDGVPMIIRTYRQCLKVIPANLIFIATDDYRIKKICLKEKAQVIMTSSRCLTGTDRVAEVAKKIRAKYYINIQGDEPLFDPNDIRKLLRHVKKNTGEILLGYCKLSSKKDLFSKNIPKIVFDKKEYLIYASRSIIPSINKINESRYFKGVWGYVFPRDKLLRFGKEKKKTPLEKSEDIEILRFVELGFKVKLVRMTDYSKPVDVKSDIKTVVKKIKKTSRSSKI